HVSRALVLDCLHRGDRRREPRHQAARRQATGRPRLRMHRPSLGRPPASDRAADLLGGGSLCGVRYTECSFLVDFMSHRRYSIWYLRGPVIFVWGVFFRGGGVQQMLPPPANPVALADLHVGVWWGALLVVLGAVYVYFFRPGRQE